MTTKRVAERGLPAPDWDGSQSARTVDKSYRPLPPVLVEEVQRRALLRRVTRHGGLDLVECLGLDDLKPVTS